MSSEKSMRIFSTTSEGSGEGKKRRYHQSHLNEADNESSQPSVGSGSNANQRDKIKKFGKRQQQEDKGYGVKNYNFGVHGEDFKVFEDPQVDVNLKKRRPDMMMTMMGLPPTKLSKNANQGQDGDIENINTAGNTQSPQKKYKREEDRSLRNNEGDSTRIPFQDLFLVNHRQNTQATNTSGGLFRNMTRISYELYLENQIERRRQDYLATIEANKISAELAGKNYQGN